LQRNRVSARLMTNKLDATLHDQEQRGNDIALMKQERAFIE
jgi:hypothetical protein